jgi:hypothetical protein
MNETPALKSPARVETKGIGSTAVAERIEALRLKLCAVGLHPGYHDTVEKAADAVVEMIAYFRAELANPPADVCGLVMGKYGVEGFTEDKEPTHRLVRIVPNVQVSQPTKTL